MTCSAKVGLIDPNNTLKFSNAKLKNTEFFNLDSISAGSLTTLTYEAIAVVTVYMSVIFDVIL